jgi:hypothetical protein
LVGLFRSRASLEAEILVLRHQLNVLRQKSPKRVVFTEVDRLLFAGLYHLAPGVLNALKIVKPETVIRWHRAGFRAYWRRRSGAGGGRPQTPLELRRLIRDVSLANPLWGAPRIHGETAKAWDWGRADTLGEHILDVAVAQSEAEIEPDPSILQVLTIIRPETLVRWHRAGFRCYWRWKSRSPGGRPQIETDLRVLIRRMSIENPLWGAPRIHGELLKLGFEVAQSSVAKYMVKRRRPPSQGWRTFLRNHAPDIAAMDLFIAPTIDFDLLYAFVIVRLDRRDLVWINVTANPTAEWIARQITEAFP